MAEQADTQASTAPPSREAEIAARYQRDLKWFPADDMGYLLAELQQARQERDKFEQQRDAAETTLSQVWIRAEIAEAALQQAREALTLAQEDADHHRHCVTCAEDGCPNCHECQQITEKAVR